MCPACFATAAMAIGAAIAGGLTTLMGRGFMGNRTLGGAARYPTSWNRR